MNRIFSILSMLLIVSVNLCAQLSVLPISADYAAFAGNNNKIYTEVYVSLYQGDLMYQIEDSVKVAHFTQNVKIFQGDSLIAEGNRSYKNSIDINNQSAGVNQFIDVFAFELHPGSYKLVVSITDNVSNKTGESATDIIIPEFTKTLNISMIEIATKMGKPSSPSNFSSKNNIEIIPNPSTSYGIYNPILYFYFEGYNLTLDKNGNNSYFYHYFITDHENKSIQDFPEKIKSSTISTIAEGTGTNVIALETGKYYLNIELKDLISGVKVTTQKKFYIKKPSKKSIASPDVVQQEDLEEYATFSKEQLEDEFHKAQYIVNENEKKIFKNLDKEGMKKFLAQFWKSRDTNPETPMNEYKRNYFESIEYANRNYSTAFKEGWLSDRGRILLIYGLPDNIERFPSTMNTDPYERWYYYSLEGGADFYFGDVTGFGQYELLHSTARNELYDPNWMQRITKIGGSDVGFDRR